MRIDTATKVYAKRVPIDIISTKESSSVTIAKTAATEPVSIVAVKGVLNFGWTAARNRKRSPSFAIA